MLRTVILYVSTFQRWRTAHFPYSGIVRSPNVKTGLFPNLEWEVLSQAQIRLVLQIGIAKSTVGMLEIFIMFRPPIRVGKWGGTEQYLVCRIARFMIGNTLQIIFGRSRVNHIHDTIVGSRCRCNFSRWIVHGESCVPLWIDFPIYQSARSPTVHACWRNDAILVRIVHAERIVYSVDALW